MRILCILLFILVGCVPNNIQKLTLDPACIWQPDRDQAVIEAIKGKVPKNSEIAGAVFQRPDDLYCYSTLATGTNHDYKYSISHPNNLKIAALFHSHPYDNSVNKRPAAAKFSQEDIDVSRRMGVPSYISTFDGLRVYTPGSKNIQSGDLVDKQAALAQAIRNTPKGTPF